jgi:hypothetical protein
MRSRESGVIRGLDALQRSQSNPGSGCRVRPGCSPEICNRVLTCQLSTMPSYRQIFYHIIFGTKYRHKTIDETNCRELYQYSSGVIRNKHCKLYRINGTEDHIHVFSDLHPSISLADYVKDIKISSSIWLKSSGKFPEFDS